MQSVKINNIAELKTRKGSEGAIVSVSGYYISGDGGGGEFYWNNTSTTTDDGGTVIQVTGVSTGRWLRKFNNQVDVKWFGISSTETNNHTIFQYVLNNFEIVNINENFTILNPVTITSKKIKLKGNNNTITLKKAQTSAFSNDYDGAIVLIDCFNVQIENLNLIYDGLDSTYEFPTNSYDGKYNGILFKNTVLKENYIIENVNISNFNRDGILFLQEIGNYSYLYKKIIVKNSIFFRNRTSGFRYEGCDGVLFEGNTSNENGKLTDFGTGYGISGGISTRTNNVKINNCTFISNIRKGIDFHSVSSNNIITNNIILGETLTGIYMDNDLSNTLIDSNIIDITISSDYSASFANLILFGSFYDTKSYNLENYTKITNNILKINNQSSVIQSIFVPCNGGNFHRFKIENNEISIKGNTVFVNNNFNVGVTTVKYDLHLENNYIYLEGTLNQNYVNNINLLSLKNNIISIKSDSNITGISTGMFRGTLNKIVLINNDIKSPATFNYIFDYGSAKVISNNTRINDLPYPTGKSYNDIICSGTLEVSSGVFSLLQGFNVSSVNKVQVGIYEVTLTSPLKGNYKNYIINCTSGLSIDSALTSTYSKFTSTTVLRIGVYSTVSNDYVDSEFVSFQVMG